MSLYTSNAKTKPIKLATNDESMTSSYDLVAERSRNYDSNHHLTDLSLSHNFNFGSGTNNRPPPYPFDSHKLRKIQEDFQ